MTHPESMIQSAICQLLQLHKLFFHSVPNERKASPQAMGRLISMGLRPGVGDLVVWWPHGIGYVEVKAPKGKQSENQKRFEDRCIKAGISYDVVYSVEDMQTLIAFYCNKG